MSAPYARFFTPPLHGGSFSLPRARDVVKTSVFTRPRKRDSSTAATGDDVKTALTDRVDKRHAELYEGSVNRAKDMGNITAHRTAAREYTRVEALFTIRLATISLEIVAALLAE